MDNNLIDSLRNSVIYLTIIKRRRVIKNSTYLNNLEAQFNETIVDSPTNNCEMAGEPIFQD